MLNISSELIAMTISSFVDYKCPTAKDRIKSGRLKLVYRRNVFLKKKEIV